MKLLFEGPRGRPTGRAAVLIKITANDGTVGWGQSVPVLRWSYETLETTYSTITRYLAPEFIGLDPFDADAIAAVMARTIVPVTRSTLLMFELRFVTRTTEWKPAWLDNCVVKLSYSQQITSQSWI